MLCKGTAWNSFRVKPISKVSFKMKPGSVYGNKLRKWPPTVYVISAFQQPPSLFGLPTPIPVP